MAYPVMGLGSIPKDMKYRFNWNAPIVACPQDPSIIYHGANHLLKTTDGGISWNEISADLTRNNKEHQGPGGIPFTNEAAGGENYNTISYVAASPHKQGVIYVGTDDGLVHLTMDEGASWQNITPPNLEESLINCIELSPHNPSTVYLSITRYKWNDKRPMIYVSQDYGKTWDDSVDGIDENAYVRVVREDHKVPGLLYAGTEKGLYLRYADSEWLPMQLNLPVSPVNDLTIRDNDLVVATSGRAFWILDDLSAIQQLIEYDKQNDLLTNFLFTPKPTYKFGLGAAGRAIDGYGQNPMPGVILDYYLNKVSDSMAVKLVILDQDGDKLRSYSSKKDPENPGAKLLPVEEGVNRFNWDMRVADYPKVKGLRVLMGLNGHTVPPGDYTVKLYVDNDSMDTEINILAYPALGATQQEFDDQYAFLNEIKTTFSEVHHSVNRLNSVKEQLISQKGLIKDLDNTDSLVSMGDSIVQKIDAWLDHLIQPKQKTFQDIINFTNQLNAELLNLKSRADGMYPQVTVGSRKRLMDLQEEWLAHKEQMAVIIDQDLVQYQQLYLSLNVPIIIVPNE
jgi:hypothetical protein